MVEKILYLTLGAEKNGAGSTKLTVFGANSIMGTHSLSPSLRSMTKLAEPFDGSVHVSSKRKLSVTLICGFSGAGGGPGSPSVRKENDTAELFSDASTTTFVENASGPW